MPALYRLSNVVEWQEVELLGRHVSGKLVLRETGKLWSGVWLADADKVRVPASAVVLQLAAA